VLAAQSPYEQRDMQDAACRRADSTASLLNGPGHGMGVAHGSLQPAREGPGMLTWLQRLVGGRPDAGQEHQMV